MGPPPEAEYGVLRGPRTPHWPCRCGSITFTKGRVSTVSYGSYKPRKLEQQQSDKHVRMLDGLEKQQPQIAEQIVREKRHLKELNGQLAEAETEIKNVHGSAPGGAGLEGLKPAAESSKPQHCMQSSVKVDAAHEALRARRQSTK
ncbi:unnamed protein product, partial [Prorocentrum cordatum]